MSRRDTSGGLCDVRRPLPPTARSAWARKRLIRAGTAIPTTANELWSQNPRTLKCSPLRKKPAAVGAKGRVGTATMEGGAEVGGGGEPRASGDHVACMPCGHVLR
eukprot:3328807-Pleurochrysis_carterae.AAC.2